MAGPWTAGIVGTVVAIVANLVIVAVARAVPGVPLDFPPLSVAPVAFFTLLGGLAATAVYQWVERGGGDVARRYVRVASVALALSFLPDLGLLAQGAPVAGVAVLVAMHVVAFAVIVGVLTRSTLAPHRAGASVG